jgi:hypothetical protein
LASGRLQPAQNSGNEIYCPISIPFTHALLSVILSARDEKYWRFRYNFFWQFPLLVKFFVVFLVRKTQFPLRGLADHVFSRASSTKKWCNFFFEFFQFPFWESDILG